MDILCSYENTIEEVYLKAGLVQHQQDPAIPHQSLEGQHSLPDQPGGHINVPDENDPLKDISVPFGGDQIAVSHQNVICPGMPRGAFSQQSIPVNK